MGLILDSSVVIRAERRGDKVDRLIDQVIAIAGEQDGALSAVGLTELIHGLYRASDAAIRARRQTFLDELLSALTIYPYSKGTALLAGRIDGEQRARGVTIPFADLLIGATALSIDFSVLTVNPRHFGLIPNLRVLAV